MELKEFCLLRASITKMVCLFNLKAPSLLNNPKQNCICMQMKRRSSAKTVTLIKRMEIMLSLKDRLLPCLTKRWRLRRKMKKSLSRSRLEGSCLRLIIGRTASLTQSGLTKRSLRRKEHLADRLSSKWMRLHSSLRIFWHLMNAKKVL